MFSETPARIPEGAFPWSILPLAAYISASMTALDASQAGEASAVGIFCSTQWSVVLAAGRAQAPDAEAALAQLCETYWYPAYAHTRRLGNGPEPARDLTQAFFLEFLSRRWYERADPDRGRFRSFLCRSLENFLHHEHERATALKRGGGREPVSLDLELAEGRFAAEPRDEISPDRAYQQSWARTLIEKVFRRLRAEFAVQAREEFFDQLRPHLWAEEGAAPYADLAREFRLTTVNVKVTVHRLRRRFGELLREEIRQTVESDAEVEEELNHLIQVLGR